MISFLLGIFVGAFGLLGYIVLRMLRSDGWDDSNIFNALRLLSHVAIHPEDFGRMWYVTYVDHEAVPFERPFHYLSEDEFETIVESRPPR